MENVKILMNPYAHHAKAVVDILDSYSRDPMGGGAPLADFTRDNLVDELRKRDWVLTLLALLEGKPVGLLIAIEGFSTFVARPLINIHDVAVLPAYRGRGVGTALFAAIEQEARKRDCCKLTLEVLSGNERAMRIYAQLGFKPYELAPGTGTAQFWEKKLARVEQA